MIYSFSGVDFEFYCFVNRAIGSCAVLVSGVYNLTLQASVLQIDVNAQLL